MYPSVMLRGGDSMAELIKAAAHTTCSKNAVDMGEPTTMEIQSLVGGGGELEGGH
jgi:hypothetical protein